MLPIVAAWAGHTEASRAFADDLRAALEAAHVKHDAFAADMGIRLPQFSRQLAGVEPMNAGRLFTALMKNPAADLAFLKLVAHRRRAELLTADEAAFVRGAVALGKKKMARMLPALVHERRVS